MEEDGKRKVFDQTLPKNIKSMKKNQRLHSLVRWDFVRKPPSTKKRGKKNPNKQTNPFRDSFCVAREMWFRAEEKKTIVCTHDCWFVSKKKKESDRVSPFFFFSFSFWNQQMEGENDKNISYQQQLHFFCFMHQNIRIVPFSCGIPRWSRTASSSAKLENEEELRSQNQKSRKQKDKKKIMLIQLCCYSLLVLQVLKMFSFILNDLCWQDQEQQQKTMELWSQSLNNQF